LAARADAPLAKIDNEFDAGQPRSDGGSE